MLRLAQESNLRERIDAMFRGDRINVSEQCSVLHVALLRMRYSPSWWTATTSCPTCMPCSIA